MFLLWVLGGGDILVVMKNKMKEFWGFFFGTYKSAKFVVLKYLVVAVLLTVSSVIANKMQLADLTYFNAVATITYFANLIGYGFSSGIALYVNQNIKHKDLVEYYVKIGMYINLVFSFVFVGVLAACYKVVLHSLLGLPKNIDYLFYFLMLVYVFLYSNLTYFIDVLKQLKQFVLQFALSVLECLLMVGGFFLVYFGVGLSLIVIPWIYIVTALVALCVAVVLVCKNKTYPVALFSAIKIRFDRAETNNIFRMALQQVVWQIGYTLLAYFVLKVNSQLFNQYSYFENVLDIFNGFLFAFVNVCSIDICRNLGEGKFDKAYKIGKYSLVSSFVIWIGYAVLAFAFSVLIVGGMSVDIRSDAFVSMALYVFMSLFRFVSWNLFSYILCWGGHTKYIFWQEVVITLYYVVFYSISAFVPCNMYLVYFIIALPAMVQSVVGIVLFRKKKWMSNISKDNEELLDGKVVDETTETVDE